MWQRMLVFPAATLLLLATAATLANAAAPETKPTEGLRDATPRVFALTGAKIVVAPGRVIERGTIVVRDGVIAAVGADVLPPADARQIDMAGKTIYAGLIDAYGETSAGDAKSGAPYWNASVTPQLSVAAHYQPDSAVNGKLRSQGVTARLVAPANGIWKGTSALVSTGDAANDQAILNAEVAQHLRLTVPRGRGRNQYPNSPMGAVALARQAMHDADWYGRAWQAYAADRSLPRPERNDALAVLKNYAGDAKLVVADAMNELYFLRADRFGREFGVRVVVRGSGFEYRRLDAVRETGRAVIVPLNFPQPPNVATAEAAMNVSLEQLMHWDVAPENPARLDRAGVPIALTSHGLKDQKTFLSAVRKAVERGLAPDSALRALTTTPAELFGVSDRLGTVESGKAANLLIADGALFDEKTKVLETWVDGRRFEIVKPPLLDVRGRWQLSLAGAAKKPESYLIELSGSAAKPSGTLKIEKSKGEAEEIKLDNLGLSDARLSFTMPTGKLGREGVAQLSAVVAIPAEDQATWLGQIVWPDGSRGELTATRVEADPAAKEEAKPKPDAKKKGDESNEADEKEADEKKVAAASYAVNYPLGAYGRTAPPEQPPLVVFENATIWTCGKAGVIERGSVLVAAGKIKAVGADIEVPKGALVVDAAGMHISPGIIDCHSHMATDGGVNESAQAVTAEVRIGDFIDSDDITIYRQLAGGVTSSNILHGSANPIGGQNQVIKLRWGDLPEAMKFAAAPEGIKFALGENVKQSNWGDEYTTRYPQSRMGVEQIMRDRFEAARAYRKQWDDWRRNHRGMPPRRDLELDAIDEILRHERWIHCHSYRQDEILALIRTLDDYKVQIGTFQHILEGYKVADAMAKHGAMGSAFSDWWAYKFEVYDAIPYNGALMHNAGVVVSFNSDDRELGRHLNHEAAKAIKYGGVPAAEALKFVTLNPARQLRIDHHVGSLEPGKDADLVVWHGSPLSTLSRCEQTWIDGRKYFDRNEDHQQRTTTAEMRATLIQKILDSGETMRKPGEGDGDDSNLWPREDIFCHHHGHGH